MQTPRRGNAGDGPYLVLQLVLNTSQTQQFEIALEVFDGIAHGCIPVVHRALGGLIPLCKGEILIHFQVLDAYHKGAKSLSSEIPAFLLEPV